jgi:hypothetical protein
MAAAFYQNGCLMNKNDIYLRIVKKIGKTCANRTQSCLHELLRCSQVYLKFYVKKRRLFEAKRVFAF